MTTPGYFHRRLSDQNSRPDGLAAIADFPKNALIELTNGCNHACIFCKNSDQARRHTHLPLEIFRDFVEQAVELGLREVGLYATGEPFMTKNLEDYVAAAKGLGIERIYLTSNGALASQERVQKCVEAGLDSIKFSINAANRRDYRAVHGFDDFETVMANVRAINRWRKDEGIALQMLASCVCIPSLPDLKDEHRKVFSEYFDDILYVNAGSQGGQSFELAIPEAWKRPVFGNIGKEVATEKIKPCAMLWNRYHLTAEGYLSGCCVDYDLDLVFGDFKKDKLRTLWNNRLIAGLRQKHLDRALEGTICDQCMHNRPAPYQPLLEVESRRKSQVVRQRESAKLAARFSAIGDPLEMDDPTEEQEMDAVRAIS
ncbi:radical SAM/SPASM domain-containing protein [Aurantimonas sp. VKM B-3413]|uniref:radical SAM/SPASM domain-containing protein n=1 Tax=Aurantimonas sp. VKM B-3413 TaxID=2779401 RepID=UPI001E4C0E07|nr:radical SAM/SPASM domain-containing protein [Aurantimonas sp. VKM B-3413]MCB8840727.1 radical SAM protein [Aurantimonas sp. VKM B-3413]